MNKGVPHMAFEWGEVGGKCRDCGTITLLVTCGQWETHYAKDGDDWVEPKGEVSGHWCPQCNRLTAVFFNDL